MSTATEFRTLDNTLTTFASAINAGFGLLESDVTFLASTLVVISMTLSALFWALSGEEVLVPFLKKILFIGLYAFIINNWVFLCGVVLNSFIDIGEKATGNTIDANMLFSPGSIAGKGVDYWIPISETIESLSGVTGFFENFDAICVLLLSGLLIMLSFFIMSIQFFVSILMFKIMTIGAFILIPFGLLKHTAFISERAFGAVISYGIKFMVLTIIMGLIYIAFDILPALDGQNMNQIFVLLILSLTCLTLAIVAPKAAAELITGGPQLGAGAMAAGALTGGAAVGLAAYGSYQAARGAGGLVSAASNPFIKAANAGNITINGQNMSSKNSSSQLSSGGLSTFTSQTSGNNNVGKGGGARFVNPSQTMRTMSQSAGSGEAGGGITSTKTANLGDE